MSMTASNTSRSSSKLSGESWGCADLSHSRWQALSARRDAQCGSDFPLLTGTFIGTVILSRSWQLPDPRSVEAVRRAHLAIASPFQTRRPQEHDRDRKSVG